MRSTESQEYTIGLMRALLPDQPDAIYAVTARGRAATQILAPAWSIGLIIHILFDHFDCMLIKVPLR